jgi:hypothetical protein
MEIAGSEVWVVSHLHSGDFPSPPTCVVSLISGEPSCYEPNDRAASQVKFELDVRDLSVIFPQ